MAKVATIKGDHLFTIKVAKGVSLHLTNAEDSEGDSVVRVTPEIFGKLQNSQAYEIPQIVVDTLVELASK